MAVARSSSGIVAKSQEEWAIVGVFFPIDNAFVQHNIWDPYKNG